MILNIDQQNELFPALLYLNMRELKNICLHFGLPAESEKIKLIESIELYLSTGKIALREQIPAISKESEQTGVSIEAILLKRGVSQAEILKSK